MKTSDRNYVAGLLEGEGCFYTRKGNQRNAIIRVAMTDIEPLIKLQSICGGNIHGPLVKKDCKPLFNWSICSIKNCQKLASEIYYLMSPRRQLAIQIMLAMKPSKRGIHLKKKVIQSINQHE